MAGGIASRTAMCIIVPVSVQVQLLRSSSGPVSRFLLVTRRRLMPAERRRRGERLVARRALERRSTTVAFNVRTLALANRCLVMHVILTQIDFPRHRNIRLVDRGPGVAHAGADFAPEVHGAVGVVVRWQDPGAETWGWRMDVSGVKESEGESLFSVLFD